MPVELRRYYDKYKIYEGPGAIRLDYSHRYRALRHNGVPEGWTKQEWLETLEVLQLKMDALDWLADPRFMQDHAEACDWVEGDPPLGTKKVDRGAAGRTFADEEDKRHWKELQNARVLLGIWPDTDYKSARKAYLAAFKKAHPDRGGTVKKSQSITWAWTKVCLEHGWLEK